MTNKLRDEAHKIAEKVVLKMYCDNENCHERVLCGRCKTNILSITTALLAFKGKDEMRCLTELESRMIEKQKKIENAAHHEMENFTLKKRVAELEKKLKPDGMDYAKAYEDLYDAEREKVKELEGKLKELEDERFDWYATPPSEREHIKIRELESTIFALRAELVRLQSVVGEIDFKLIEDLLAILPVKKKEN